MIRSLLACLVLAAAGCAHVAASPGDDAVLAGARQVVVVTTAGWNEDHGVLRTFERDAAGAWQPVDGARAVVVGRAGAGWGSGLHAIPADAAGDPVKREGDGRAPAGIFAIGTAYGYATSADTALPYAPLDAGDYCIDVSGSPLYNRIVDAADVGAAAIEGSTEPMRRDLHADGDQRYRLGFVVEHNAQATPMAGSCIFAHLWKTPDTATAGCTAMAPETMDALLRWLDPSARPRFVLLPEARYTRLQQAWGLPELPQ